MIDSDKLELKQRLLAECLRLQRETVENVRSAMNEAQESANDNEDDTEDTLTNSYREEMQNRRDLFAQQLETALDDLALLNKVVPSREQDTVGFGSVVVTPQQTLFISISLGQIKLDGKSFFAISPSAPLYKAMSGKKKGEKYAFRDQEIKIEDVY